MTKRLYFLSLFLLITASASAGAKPLRIVASIKPVHSLVAGITHGIIEPGLLMSSTQSPHHYSLRPSERRMLDEADLIFWIGPTMESFMPRLLDGLKNKNKAVALIQGNGLKLLNTRQAGHGDEQDDHDHEHAKIDAHIWLDTKNVDLLIDIITQHIVQADPEHRQQYEANSLQLHNQVAQLRKTLQQSLSTIDKSFLTYHDGYQYFETEFGLHNAGFVTSSELQPSAQRIGDLKKLIEAQKIACVFYDAPTKPPILKSLLSNSSAAAFMLDPIGMHIPPGKNLWFDSMQALAEQFINCQQHL